MIKCHICGNYYKDKKSIKIHKAKHFGTLKSNKDKAWPLGRFIVLTDFNTIHTKLFELTYETRTCINQILRNQDYFLNLVILQKKPLSELTQHQLRSLYFCVHPKLVKFMNKWLKNHEKGSRPDYVIDKVQRVLLRQIVLEIIGEAYNIFPDFEGSQSLFETSEIELPEDFRDQVLDIPDEFWMRKWVPPIPIPERLLD